MPKYKKQLKWQLGYLSPFSSYGSRMTYEEGIQVGSTRWQVHPYCPAFSPPIQPPAAAALPHRSRDYPEVGLK